MSIWWRMGVTSSTGSARDYVTMDDAVASLDTFSLDRAGSCLEASFTALPSAVDIQPRDLIILQTSADGSAWVDRWTGVIVQAGNPRSHDVQAYRAVGMKQRLYEVILRAPVITGDDVANMAHEVAMLAHASVRGVSAPASFAEVDFELGDRHPGLETMGDFMDALAATAGTFIAPAGGYAYDGTNYAEGDAVPAVAWGVDASGELFFRRPQVTALTLDEADASTRVTWTETTAEEHVNSVTLVYATEVQSERLIAWGRTTGTSGQTETLAVAPLTHAFTSAAAQDEASALVTLPAPLDYMEALSPPTGTVDMGTVNLVAYATDGDFDTCAYMMGGSQVRWESRSVSGPVIWRVRMAWYAGFDITIRVQNYYGTDLSTLVYAIKGADRESDGDPVDLWLPSLSLASVDFGGTPRSRLTMNATQNTPSSVPEVYEVEYYLPDCDESGTASELLAEAFLRPIPSGVAIVESFALGAVTQTIDLTTITGEELGLSVERVEYAFTTGEGVVTRYHVGQAYASDLLAQRAVLERLARRATSGVLP